MLSENTGGLLNPYGNTYFSKYSGRSPKLKRGGAISEMIYLIW
jgi:hypothetical protein